MNYLSLLLYRAFRRITLIINQQMHYSKEQRSSLRMILGSKHVGAILSVLM